MHLGFGGPEGTLTLPPETRAFYFYGLGTVGGQDVFTVTAEDGQTLRHYTDSYDGPSFALYVTEPDETLTSVRVITFTRQGFSVGQFGIAIPEPASALLLMAGGLTLRRRR